ncbi:WbqC family protein [Alteromonas sp. Cnat3-28]|uniref:WbqC family protein n=1 Tax=Alteromonas sp. Cnat3-28 TaxID=2917729 RepID=UPI001EF45489|nr:WbqC family protein [Alteromonas sp. Cnat3-28]MCG7644901.1 WbqC family protein [Alteromonas sp. Cnat3-28]
MILAVMQPYLFPYLGYYQLTKHCDKFVFYDDVNFIKGGYINRNNILANNKKQLFTIPVEKASSNSKIKDLHFVTNRKKIIKTIEQNYSKAPLFSEVMPILDNVFNSQETHVARLCMASVTSVFDYLGIELDCCLSSELDYNKHVNAAEKLYSMCDFFGAGTYCNMENGRALYSKNEFKRRNIDLQFLAMEEFSYPQGTHDFVSHLSIIDVLMWNSKKDILRLLDRYRIS